MEILKWFSGNTEMKVEILNHGHVCTNMQIWSRRFHTLWLLWLWLYWSKWCFLPVQLHSNKTICTSAYLLITYHRMSKSIQFWKKFFLFWVFPPCIAVLVCLLVKATGNWDSEHHLLLLLCLLLTYKYKTIEDGGITVDF